MCMDFHTFSVCVFSCIWGWNRSRTEETPAAPGFRPTAASRSWPDASHSPSDGTRSNPASPWPWSTGSAVHAAADSVSASSHHMSGIVTQLKQTDCYVRPQIKIVTSRCCTAWLHLASTEESCLWLFQAWEIHFVCCSFGLILGFKFR